MKLDFTGKTAIVTGGSRGIGKAISEVILRAGGSVIITSTGEAPEWMRKYHNASHVMLDFLDRARVTEGIARIVQRPRIDILVNNAGVLAPNAIDVIGDSDWERVLAVNLGGPMRMMRAVAPIMKKQHCGWIINVGSISGIIARPRGSAYSASKAGLLGLTRATALDLAPWSILVNAVCPGTTETDMVERALTSEQKEIYRNESALKRMAKPEEIANVAAFLCSDLNTYITGQAIVADGGTIIQ